MPTRIAVIQGHPDPDRSRFCRALADAYAQGAELAGHQIRRIEVADLEFPALRSKTAFESGAVPDTIRQCQEAISWAEHLLIVYPLWLGSMPGAPESVSGAGVPARLCDRRATLSRHLEEAADGQIRAHRRDHGHARLRLPLVLPRAQPQEPGAEHPEFFAASARSGRA